MSLSVGKRVLIGCLGLPVLLVGGCVGKIALDSWLYELPGEVLRSSMPPTQTLGTALEVAEALDAYVQPRFEILRDKNFGAMRIVYRKHAGIVQLKVDSDDEKRQIANVNAAGRDYAISLLHCAPKPPPRIYRIASKPWLELLYFNQDQVVTDNTHYFSDNSEKLVKDNRLSLSTIEAQAIAALPTLKAGKETRGTEGEWSVLMRPVLAAKPECLSCHTNTKPNATLGVMVYAVRNTKTHAPQKL